MASYITCNTVPVHCDMCTVLIIIVWYRGGFSEPPTTAANSNATSKLINRSKVGSIMGTYTLLVYKFTRSRAFQLKKKKTSEFRKVMFKSTNVYK